MKQELNVAFMRIMSEMTKKYGNFSARDTQSFYEALLNYVTKGASGSFSFTTYAAEFWNIAIEKSLIPDDVNETFASNLVWEKEGEVKSIKLARLLRQKICFSISPEEMQKRKLLPVMSSMHVADTFVKEARELGYQAYVVPAVGFKESMRNSSANDHMPIENGIYPVCGGHFFVALRVKNALFLIDPYVGGFPESVEKCIAKNADKERTPFAEVSAFSKEGLTGSIVWRVQEMCLARCWENAYDHIKSPQDFLRFCYEYNEEPAFPNAR